MTLHDIRHCGTDIHYNCFLFKMLAFNLLTIYRDTRKKSISLLFISNNRLNNLIILGVINLQCVIDVREHYSKGKYI